MADLCKRAGVERINIHGMRHVAAVLALKAVQDAHLVQRRLGHSHVSITMGVYAYATGDDGDVASAIGQLLSTQRTLGGQAGTL
jgi:integrase